MAQGYLLEDTFELLKRSLIVSSVYETRLHFDNCNAMQGRKQLYMQLKRWAWKVE